MEEKSDDAYEGCLVCYHPHGVVPTTIGAIAQLRPLQDAVLLFSTGLCVVPIFRLFLLLSGQVLEVKRSNLEKCLRTGKQCMIVPGGVREMHLCRPFCKRVAVYTGHKGFLKLALRHGRNLLPVICFEENDLMQNCCPMLERECYYRAGLEGCPCWSNRYCLPLSNRLRVHVALGRVVHVPKDTEPTEAVIEKLHVEYYSEVKRLFDARKAEFGHAERELVFYSAEDMNNLVYRHPSNPWETLPSSWPEDPQARITMSSNSAKAVTSFKSTSTPCSRTANFNSVTATFQEAYRQTKS
eukprot:CAMPEP_0178445704 /NCGR_PEP_ID=MMETSP0689_2-20121128/40337_1 /TAXON_ID=160604 /ORGANISM="Amphidinium massartii, Strain CS-259" /LENGTH=296 /DNA_ID=CAMNT_0020070329 /DNA_START=216 /DNA_END=1102 /DNA_ORIENTATION=+